MPTLAERVQWARKQKGWRQEDLADAVGTSRAQIQKIENGTITRPRNMEALADALDVSKVWLAYGDPRLEQLTPEAADLAIAWQHLPEDAKEAARLFIETAAKRKQGK